MASWWHEGRGEQTEADEQMDLAVTRMTNIATLRSKKATEDRLNAAVIKVTSSNGSVTLPRNKPHKAYMLHLPPDGTLTVVVENIDAELDFDVTRDLSRVQANSSAHSVTVKPESYVKENGNVGSGEIIIRTGNHNATTLQVLDVQITEKPFLQRIRSLTFDDDRGSAGRNNAAAAFSCRRSLGFPGFPIHGYS